MFQFLSSLGISAKAVAAVAVIGAGLVTAAAVVPASVKLPNPGITSSPASTPAVSPSASPSPSATATPATSTHGALVVQAVASCKAALTAGQHGIGQCVEKVASSNGQKHRAAAATQHNSSHVPVSPGSAAGSH